MSDRPEFFLFLPQLNLPMPAIVERARAAEAAGFTGIALMDHFAPPLAEDRPVFEAMTTAAVLAASTSTLKVSHLVLCDSFRSPALLAKQAATLDHASQGRFELGLGSGSVPGEFSVFGIDNPGHAARLRRLAETLEVLGLLWTGEPVDFEGEFHRLRGALQSPTPLTRIPVVLGGVSDTILDLASRHADWWNMPLSRQGREADMLGRAKPARTSVQQMVAFVPTEGDRESTAAMATRRFGRMPGGGPLIGDVGELREHFLAEHSLGVERFYVWFADAAPPLTLEGFAAVIAESR